MEHKWAEDYHDRPNPGVYRGVPMADYHDWNAASNSRLGKLMRSPAHCKAAIDEVSEDTAALAFGRAAHTAILEPDQFDYRYMEAEQCSSQTKKGDRCKKMGTTVLHDGHQVCSTHWLTHADQLGQQEILSPADWNHCLGMREAVHGIERAHNMLAGLEDVEVSVRWDDKETGVACKARWDGVADFAGGCILDFKTTIDASPREFERSIFKYGYHRQGAMYLEAADAHGIPAKHYVIIATEKVPPYGTCLYRLTEGAIAVGADQIRNLLGQYHDCLEDDDWYGYSEEVQDIGLPSWAWNQMEELA